MSVVRKDAALNDAIAYLDDVYLRASNNVQVAVAMLDDAELAFIDDETEKCLDLRYYLENYHCIRDEHGNWKSFYPWFEYQEILYEAIQEEWAEHGYCKIIVLKPRQSGISTWTAASMFHRTIFNTHMYTMLVGQNAGTSEHIYGMSMNAYDALPWWMRPEYMYKTKGDEIVFQREDENMRTVNPGLGSVLKCSNAQKMSGIAIGRSLQSFHGCLTEKNLILRPDGSVDSIKNALVGTQVMTDKGPALVSAYSARPAKDIFPGAEEGYQFIPWCNSAFPIEGTGNHKILCVTSQPLRVIEKRAARKGEKKNGVFSEPEMVEFRSITNKHSIAVAIREITEGGSIPPSVDMPKRPQGGGLVSEWTPPMSPKDIGFAVGLYLAEGSVNRRITITLDRDEKELADRFSKAVRVPYGKVVYRTDSRTTQYHFYGSAMGEWFRRNVGEGDEKKIPDWLWGLGREALAACVEAMILGDGHISPRDRRTSFMSTRAQLAIGIRDAVLALGHGYGGIISREAGFHYGRNCQKVYRADWCQKVDRSLRKEYGWKQVESPVTKDYVHWHYSADRHYVYLNIRKMSRVQIGTVYDIEVDTEDHTFLLPSAVTHNSEVSRWPDDGMFEADIKPSMNARDTYAILESTGFGRQGFFYEHWRGSLEGDTGYRGVFIPVYRSRKYYLPFNKNNPAKNESLRDAFSLLPDEVKFNAKVVKEEKFEIPKEFWHFHRKGMRAAKTANAKAGFIESYPLTPAQAFQASGICAFDRDSLESQEMRFICKPIAAGEISLSATGVTANTDAIHSVADDEILPKRKGDRPAKRLHIWEFPEQGETYYVGGDVALGVQNGDYSVAEVFRSGTGTQPDTQVAEWWGHCPPKDFALIMAALGYWYNGAELAVEYMKDGITTGDKLVEMDYPALYRERFKDRPGGAFKQYFHFTTNEKTRSSIIASMNEALLYVNRNGDPGVILRSEDLLDEMTDFGSLGGKMEGQGNHDDSVMSAMISLYCLRETTVHLKGSANDGAGDSEHVDDINQYVVYDHLMRQRGQYQSREMAYLVIEDKPGWTVQPMLICKANTLWSPIYDGQGAEHKLRFQHGLSAGDITPDMVYSFQGVMSQHAMGGNSDPDW